MSDIFHGINGCLNFPMSMSCPSVILNSLTHQDFVPRSLSLLDAAGRFVELAKLQAICGILTFFFTR